MKNKNIITKLNFETKIGLLDWFILLSIILLLLIVYIPNSIWAEEKKDREESRFRMKAIANAAEFYNELNQFKKTYLCGVCRDKERLDS